MNILLALQKADTWPAPFFIQGLFLQERLRAGLGRQGSCPPRAHSLAGERHSTRNQTSCQGEVGGFPEETPWGQTALEGATAPHGQLLLRG